MLSIVHRPNLYICPINILPRNGTVHFCYLRFKSGCLMKNISSIFPLLCILVVPTEGPPPKKQRSESKRSEKEKKKVTVEQVKTDNEITVEVDGAIEKHVHLSPQTPAVDPPEPEEMIKALQDLENKMASRDEAVRQRIAQLPKEVSDISLLTKIEGV